MVHLIHKIMQGGGIKIVPILIFVSLLRMAKPSFSRPVNCKRFNYLEVDLIARNGHRTRYCLIGRERNQNGAIYKVGVPHTDEGATIYAGKSGDAIIEVYQGRYVDRIDGSWRRVGDEFYFQFSGAKVYIPVF